MVDTKNFIDTLVDKFKVEEFCGVPCSNLKYLINETSNRGIYKPFTNEGEAVSYAAGCKVAGKNVAVLIQNSGLTNSSSPISSLTSLYDIPLIYIVGHRGFDPKNDEPQHRIIGPNTVQFIQDITDNNCVFAKPEELLHYSETFENRQTFVLVTKGTFSEVKLYNSRKSDSKTDVSRDSAIKLICNIINSSSQRNNTSIVSTTGYTSRELISINGENNPMNFYCFGSMGCAYSFAKGLADTLKSRKFIVIDGDGSTAMRFESSFTGDSKNLFRIIVRNDEHQSTGGQYFEFDEFEKALSSRFNYIKCSTLNELRYWLTVFLEEDSSPIKGVILRVNDKVSSDLPRPKLEMSEILNNFKQGLSYGSSSE